MKTAFVLAGGGSLGAVQAGMLLVLAEAGIGPELVVGTSVGATVYLLTGDALDSGTV